jgi:hypothetical protein
MNRLKNRNLNGELLTYAQAAERANLGEKTVMRLARESGALVKIGRSARVNWSKFYQYLLAVYGVASEE